MFFFYQLYYAAGSLFNELIKFLIKVTKYINKYIWKSCFQLFENDPMTVKIT